MFEKFSLNKQNQQSCSVRKNFFIICLISSHPWDFFISLLDQHSSWNDCCSGFTSSLLIYRSFLSFGARMFHFPKYNKNAFLRKCKKVFNLRARKYHFPKYKNFLLEKYKKFFRVDFFFFNFLSLGLKVVQVPPKSTSEKLSNCYRTQKKSRHATQTLLDIFNLLKTCKNTLGKR